MLLTLLKSKIHRARVSHAELDYEGSCAIDQDLMDAANIRPFEQLHIYNIRNGERFTTYAISAEAGSGTIGINGAAAHKAKPDDLIIICTYAQLQESMLDDFQAALVYVDAANKISHCSQGHLAAP